MNKSVVEDILSKMQKPASMVDAVRRKVPESRPRVDKDPEADEYIPVGLGGILAASEKLLAVNRELDKPDTRDSLVFKRIMTTDKLLAERIKLDADKTRMRLLPMLAKQRSFRNLTPYAFDNYTTGYLLGNPLVTPLEEINPMHLVEQTRRITQMGPGGIGTDNAITEDMQNISPDQFGFVSTLEGPESSHPDTEVFTSRGWVPWPDVTMEDKLACNDNGAMVFAAPEELFVTHFDGDLVVGRHSNICMRVTPNHRVVHATNPIKDWSKYKIKLAAELYGKSIRIPCWHAPYSGDTQLSHFELPGIGFVAIEDLGALVGWYLSEGNITDPASLNNHVCITQCSIANLDNYKEICDLLARMGVKYTTRKYGPSYDDKGGLPNGFLIYNKLFYRWLLDFVPGGRLCHEKGFPDVILTWPTAAREACLAALMKGDGRINKTHRTYLSTSRALAEGVERLMISLGLPCRIREEKDYRAHVKTTNWAVCQFKVREKTLIGNTYGHSNGKTYGNHWSKEPYKGPVYSARVPGGLVYLRGSRDTQGYWSGNSEKIGIDTRAAWGTKIGSDGKLYQVVYDRKRKKHRWVSAADLDGKTVKIPD